MVPNQIMIPQRILLQGAVQRIQFESELTHVGDYEYPGGLIITYHISNSSWLLTPIGIAVQCPG
jgi:hypothetical protein